MLLIYIIFIYLIITSNEKRGMKKNEYFVAYPNSIIYFDTSSQLSPIPILKATSTIFYRDATYITNRNIHILLKSTAFFYLYFSEAPILTSKNCTNITININSQSYILDLSQWNAEIKICDFKNIILKYSNNELLWVNSNQCSFNCKLISPNVITLSNNSYNISQNSSFTCTFNSSTVVTFPIITTNYYLKDFTQFCSNSRTTLNSQSQILFLPGIYITTCFDKINIPCFKETIIKKPGKLLHETEFSFSSTLTPLSSCYWKYSDDYNVPCHQNFKSNDDTQYNTDHKKSDKSSNDDTQYNIDHKKSTIFQEVYINLSNFTKISLKEKIITLFLANLIIICIFALSVFIIILIYLLIKEVLIFIKNFFIYIKLCIFDIISIIKITSNDINNNIRQNVMFINFLFFCIKKILICIFIILKKTINTLFNILKIKFIWIYKTIKIIVVWIFMYGIATLSILYMIAKFNEPI